MGAEFLHVGVPITNKRPGMTYNDGLKLWLGNPADNEMKVEYLRFEEGGPFPEIMHQNPHIAYKVDDMEKYLKDADQVIFGPADMDGGGQMAFIIKDNLIIELMT